MTEHRGSISHLHALHQVTGSIALYGFGERLTAERLEEWAEALETTADLMRKDAKGMRSTAKRSRQTGSTTTKERKRT